MESSAPMKREYFGALDTLRFLAFLCVFVSHIFVFSDFKFSGNVFEFINTYFLTQGNLGVTFFFVLSGFLITYLLYKEQDKYYVVSIKNFYIRRILRIWPVYFTVVLIGFVIVPFIFSSFGFLASFANQNTALASGYGLFRLPWFAFFAANFDMVMHGPAALFLAVLWSVSVEEQFYLVWPWLVSFFRKEKVVPVLVFIMFLSFQYRLANIGDLNSLRYSTFSVVSDLATGALAAYFIAHFSKLKDKISTLSKSVGWMLVLLVPILFWFNKVVELYSFSSTSDYAHAIYALAPQLLAVFFAAVILYSCFNKEKFIPTCVSRATEHLGQISYGLYCYHGLGIVFAKATFFIPLFAVFSNSIVGFVASTLIAFVFTLLFSELSYTYMEKPVLKLKRRFEV